jgi:hypothetical protein
VVDVPWVRVKHEVSKQMYLPGSEHAMMRQQPDDITSGVNVLKGDEDKFLHF